VLFRFSLATVALLGLSATSVFGQAPNANANAIAPPAKPPKTGATSVALVDVGAIIKSHPTMNAEMERIKADMESAHDAIESRRKALLSESETIVKAYDPSSAEFKQKQEELLNKESKLRVDFLGQEKEFAEKQAKVVFDSYQDINRAIKTVAEAYSFDIILRYSKEQDEMDPKKPQSVNFGLQRDVLYQSPGVDVTDFVQFILKRDYASKGVMTPPQSTNPGTRAANVNQPGVRR
jgi:Skp family chaperone for outer membrane proteins